MSHGALLEKVSTIDWSTYLFFNDKNPIEVVNSDS